MSLKDHCHCGHAKESHFEKKAACLGTFCECRKYQLYSDPYVDEPPTDRILPAARPTFDPFDPYGASPDDDSCPPTWPMFPAAVPPSDP